MTSNASQGSLSLVMHREHSPQPAEESALRKPDRPLLLRLYASPLLVEIVRRIGYRAWERDDACDQLLPLMRRQGVRRVVEAATELIVVDDQHDSAPVRLAEHVRRMAVGILGHEPDELSPTAPWQPSIEISDAHEEGPVAEDYRRVETTRADAVSRYARHLEIVGEKFEPAEAAALPRCPSSTPVAFDFVVHRQDQHALLAVRQVLSKQRSVHLRRWLMVLGPEWRAGRVWPIESPPGWLWEREWMDVVPPSQSGPA